MSTKNAVKVTEDVSWYKKLIEDCVGIIQSARTNLLAHKHQLGTRIKIEQTKFENSQYGNKTIINLAEELETSPSDLWSCVKFCEVFPQIDKVAGLDWKPVRAILYEKDETKREGLIKKARTMSANDFCKDLSVRRITSGAADQEIYIPIFNLWQPVYKTPKQLRRQLYQAMLYYFSEKDSKVVEIMAQDDDLAYVGSHMGRDIALFGTADIETIKPIAKAADKIKDADLSIIQFSKELKTKYSFKKGSTIIVIAQSSDIRDVFDKFALIFVDMVAASNFVEYSSSEKEAKAASKQMLSNISYLCVFKA